jgi:hypothetical protein
MMAMSRYLSWAHRRISGVVVMALVLAVVGGGVVYALGAPPRRAVRAVVVGRRGVRVTAGARVPWLSIRAESSGAGVVVGGVVAFGVRIARAVLPLGWTGNGGWHRGVWVWLGVTTRLPPGIVARYMPRVTRASGVRLTFTVGAAARAGVYRVRLNAHGRSYRRGGYRGAHAYTFLTLRVSSPPSARFTIAGSPTALLAPGGAAGIDLRVTNPGGRAVRVSSLVVGVKGVRAPLASPTRPCTVADFAVAQFSGGYGFSVPGSSTRSLGQLGFAVVLWPRVLMLDRPVNQDGCQHATVLLSFSGVARGPS